MATVKSKGRIQKNKILNQDHSSNDKYWVGLNLDLIDLIFIFLILP